MEQAIDFSEITPCGGSCNSCSHKQNGECEGCLENGGKCVSMWENGCEIFKCCDKNNVPFCGLCDKFPCDWITEKLSEWDKNGIEKQRALAAEYRKINIRTKI